MVVFRQLVAGFCPHSMVRCCAVVICAVPGTAAPPGVASQLAKAAVAASYSDDAAAAAAAAASRNTFTAWAERVAQDPQAAAQRVTVRRSSLCRDVLCYVVLATSSMQHA